MKPNLQNFYQGIKRYERFGWTNHLVARPKMANDGVAERTRTSNFISSSTVHTAYSVIGYSAKSDIVSTLGWYGIPYTNNYCI